MTEIVKAQSLQEAVSKSRFKVGQQVQITAVYASPAFRAADTTDEYYIDYELRPVGQITEFNVPVVNDDEHRMTDDGGPLPITDTTVRSY